MRTTKYKGVLFLLAAVLFFAFPSAIMAFKRSVRVSVFEPNDSKERDFYTVSGERVEIKGDIKGDVYAVGYSVEVKGNIDGDLLVLGSEVEVLGNVSQDVRIIAQTAKIDGKVGRNLLTIANETLIDSQAQVEGGVFVWSNSVFLEGDIKGDIRVYGSRVEISAFLGGDVEVRAYSVSLLPGSSIGGDLVYYTEEPISIDESVRVRGRVFRGSYPYIGDFEDLKIDEIFPQIKFWKKIIFIINVISTFVAGVLMLKIFPNYTLGTANEINSNPLKTFLVGVGAVIFIPFGAAFLAVTLAGIPIGVLVLAVYGLFLYLSKIIFSIWLGSAGAAVGFKSKILQFSLGIIVYFLLSMLGGVKWVLYLVSAGLGFGALVRANYRYLRSAYKENKL